MKRLIAVLGICCMFVACEKNDAQHNDDANDEQALKDGQYKGWFNRTGMDTVNVSISLHQGRFEGSSGQDHYPAICHGSFKSDGTTVNFSDSCVWQANFDWSLILNGRYELSADGNNIRIRKHQGAVTDEYHLTLQTR